MGFFKLISKALAFVGLVVTVILLVMVVADVTCRTLFNYPLMGVIEFTELLMVVLALTVPMAAIEKRHLRIDTFVNLLPLRGQVILSCITHVISFGVYLVMGWQTYKFALYSKGLGQSTSLLHIPRYPFLFILTISLLALCLMIVGLIIEDINQYKIKNATENPIKGGGKIGP